MKDGRVLRPIQDYTTEALIENRVTSIVLYSEVLFRVARHCVETSRRAVCRDIDESCNIGGGTM